MDESRIKFPRQKWCNLFVSIHEPNKNLDPETVGIWDSREKNRISMFEFGSEQKFRGKLGFFLDEIWIAGEKQSSIYFGHRKHL